MRTNAPITIALTAGVTIGAHLLIAHHLPHRPTASQLNAAHTAGYRLALSHVARGHFTTAPEEP